MRVAARRVGSPTMWRWGRVGAGAAVGTWAESMHESIATAARSGYAKDVTARPPLDDFRSVMSASPVTPPVAAIDPADEEAVNRGGGALSKLAVTASLRAASGGDPGWLACARRGRIGSLALHAAHVEEQRARALVLRPIVVRRGRPRLAQVLDEVARVTQHREPAVQRAVDLVEGHFHAAALDDFDRPLHVEVRPPAGAVARGVRRGERVHDREHEPAARLEDPRRLAHGA